MTGVGGDSPDTVPVGAFPSGAFPRKTRPAGSPQLLVRGKTRPAGSPQLLVSGKTRPMRHKRPIVGHFSFAGRTISRTGRSHVATMQPLPPLQPLMQASMKPPSPLLTPERQPLKPTTPLQPLMQTNVKPPSPMLAPEQRPLKPPTPLQPENASKTPISHPQRRRRFQLRLSLREQRCHRFQPHTRTSEQRRWWFHLRLALREQRR